MQKRLVIVGGGFAGLHLAYKLANTNYKVTLIDKLNHHQFQPLFYQVATARLEPSNISFPFRKIFQKTKNIEIRLAEVENILPEKNTVITSTHQFNYDYLVIANGCQTNFFGNDQISTYALSMKSTEDAINIRNEILLSFEKFITAVEEEKQALLNIVIVGAGATGVELAGSFAEMKKYILPKDYPGIDFSGLTVTLIEGSKNTLNNMSSESQTASRMFLLEMGVVIRTETFVTSYDGTTLTLKDGEQIKSKNVIWAAGVIGNRIEGIDEASVNRNRYIVDRFHKIKNYSNLYAIGDIAYMVTPKYPTGHPQLANVAINQGKNLGNNFVAMLNQKSQKEYEYKDLGSMATVGKHKAVVDLKHIKFQGRIAWYVWMFLHLMLILSIKNKLAIFINWAWNYITKDSSLRLIFKSKK